jgi:hypothetical protein
MSLLEVNKITPQSGTTLVLGDSGDTINFGSGVLPNFENLTVTGDLTVDTNSLKVDSTNNYVGIGTASPSSALDIVGNIVVSGTVDGRDIATDGTKLDTIATNATANPNAIDNVVEDTTPQLGGNLDLNSNNITGTGNISITGTVAATSYTGDGSSLTGINTDLVSDTTPQLGGDLASNGHDILMADNDKINVGTSNDLQIYHDGSHSIIADVGTGNLEFRGTHLVARNGGDTGNYFQAIDGAQVELYYNGSSKMSTTSTGIDVTGTITADGLSLGDSEYAYFGASNDLLIGHNGTNSYVSDQGTGSLLLEGNSQIVLQSTTGEDYIVCNNNGSVDLYYDNSKKFETTSTGATLTGDLLVTEGSPTITFIDTDSNGSAKLFCDGGSGSGNLYIDADTNNALPNSALHLRVDGTDKVVIDSSGNVSVDDNQKIQLGNSDDLEIFHDGSNSYISDVGTGDLRIQADNNVDIKNSSGAKLSIRCQASSAVNLYYDNSKKLETTSSGVTVTGTLTETSSIEYKENVQPLEFNEAIYNVNAVKYDRKDGSQKDEVGVIAEDLYEILPDLVQTKDGKPESVKYTKLTMYLLEALKKQNEEIQELKKRLN